MVQNQLQKGRTQNSHWTETLLCQTRLVVEFSEVLLSTVRVVEVEWRRTGE